MKMHDVMVALDGLVPGPPLELERLAVTGAGSFASAFDVDTAALASVASAALVNGDSTIDRDRVVATFSGRVDRDGRPVEGWADLSGYYRTRDDRVIQFHCNFDHHAHGVVRRLGCEPTRASIQKAVLGFDPAELD